MPEESADFPTPQGSELAPRPDRPKTKIDSVREQLQTNPNVFFAGELHNYHPEAPEYGYWTETVDIIVAPTSPIFDADQLNTFMNNLIKGVEPSTKDEAGNSGDGGLRLGKLYYDEDIGTIRKVTQIIIETTEPETIQRAKKTPGESQQEWQAKMQRRTWIRVYPDPTSAATVHDYEAGVANGTVEPNSEHGYAHHWLDGEQVRQLKAEYNNPLSKIKGFLRGHK